MDSRNKILGINRKVIIIMHRIILASMLHATLVIPCQAMIYTSNIHDGLKNAKGENNEGKEEKNHGKESAPVKKSFWNKEDKNADFKKGSSKLLDYVISSDIHDGIIGVTNTSPLDDAKDNLFKFYIQDLPSEPYKVYLTYELFGLQDCNGVSRSINDRPAKGGYVIKNQTGWTSQSEEIDINWLRAGENKIMFGIPKGANFQYQVKNVTLKFEASGKASLTPPLVVTNTNLNYIKDGKLYVKGFIKKYGANVKILVEETHLAFFDGEFEGFLQLTDAMRKKSFVLVSASDEMGILGQEIIMLDNLAEADKIFNPEEDFRPLVALAKANTETTIKSDGFSLVVNKSALKENKEIHVLKLRTVDIAPMSSGLVNVTRGGHAYRFLPDGTKFSSPVSLSIDYDENLIPKGHNANEIKTFYFDVYTKAWTPIARDSINKTTSTILSYTNHFTDYINGIIQTPESPETAGFAANMMNGIKVADPSSEMTLIAPPEVSQKGDANISYPIKLPAGRKGVQPQIALQYSNESGNGWLGQGWSIGTPSINIDTRWGVPTFTSDKESEIYSLNGEQLMYPKQNGKDWMPNRHYDADGAPDGTYSTEPITRSADRLFTMRKQGGFAKIERLGTSTAAYYWKVTNSDGSINWYGGKNAVDPNAVIKNSKGDIVHWALYMVQDVFGNTMKYQYTPVPTRVLSGQSGENANLNGGIVFHIQNIKYTGFNDSDYKYEVIFNSAATIRQDVSINARLGVKQIEPYFLENIIVKKIGTSAYIRKYQLNFGYGKFKKGQLQSVSELDGSGTLFYTHKFDYYNDVTVGNSDFYFSQGVLQEFCTDLPPSISCEDSDRDGVCNEVDICPTIAGPASNNGCPLTQSDTSIKSDYANYFKNLGEVNSFRLAPGDPPPTSCNPITFNSEFLIPGFIRSFDSAGSLLGSSKSEAISAGFYIGIGVGKNMFTKMTTFGVQWNWGNDKSIAMTALVDINGDGLEDIVSRNGNSLFYKLHTVTRTYNASNESVIRHSFQPPSPINGIDNFYRAFGRNRSSNFQITYGLKRIGGFIGWDKSKSTSETDIFFTDGNGDGLLDIVRDGVVYFNRLDSNGNPNFIPDSKGTENLIITAAPKTIEVPDVYHQEEITLPAFDVVKVWEAPADGTIKIDNAIQLTDDTKEAVVTVEVKKQLPPKCYSVSFPVPYVSTILYGYVSAPMVIFRNSIINPNYPTVSGLCMPTAYRIKSTMLNGQTFFPNFPDKLFLAHGNSVQGILNQCPNVLPPIVAQISTNDIGDSSIQSSNSESIIQDWYQNAALANIPYSSFNFQNRYGVILEQISAPQGFLYQYCNLSNYYLTFKSTLDITGGITTEQFSNGINWNMMPVSSFYKSILNTLYIGIPANISINGSNLQNNPYNLFENFNQFQSAFQTQYPGSAVSITNNVVTISILNTDQLFSTIKITPTSGSPGNTYSFNEVSCDMPKTETEIIVVSKDDWKDYKLSKEESVLAIKKWEASGGELNIPIPDRPDLNIMVDAKDIIDERSASNYYYLTVARDTIKWSDANGVPVADERKIETLNRLVTFDTKELYEDQNKSNELETTALRKKNQATAASWLEEYYNRQEIKIENTESAASRSVDQNTCNETPSELCTLYGTKLSSSNLNIANTLTANCAGGALTVKKGDRIYFRVHSVDNGNPTVQWDPKVEYTNAGYSTITDANGHKPFSISYSDGFVLSSKAPVAFPGDSGSAKINWAPFTVTPTDAVTFEIIKETVSSPVSDSDDPPTVVSSSVLYTKTCNPNVATVVSPAALPADLSNIIVSAPPSADNLSQTFFYFKVISTSNIDWRNSIWKPSIEFITSAPIIAGEGGATEGNIVSNSIEYPVADYDLYRIFPCGTAFSKKNISSINGGNGLSIKPQIAGVFSSGDNGKINFVVKRGTAFLGSRVFTVSNGSVSVNNTSAISLGISADPNLEIMYTADDSKGDGSTASLLSKLALTGNALAVITYGTGSVNVPKTEIGLYQKTDSKFGSFFRQWGQFMYRPANVTGALPSGIAGTNLIKEEALNVTLTEAQAGQLNADLGGINENMTPEQLENFQANHLNYINSLAFISANATRELIDGTIIDRWTGFHKENYASESGYKAEKLNQSASILEENYPNTEQDVLKTGAYAISRYAQGHSNNNFSAGINGFGYGINGSLSNGGVNNSLSDYVDYNGDRYPDIATTDNIQYTTKTGGLTPSVSGNRGDVSTSSSDSKGFGASASFSKGNQDLGAMDAEGKSGFKRFDGFRGNSGAGISGNFTDGHSKTSRIWTDINGDGLPDLLSSDSGTTNVILNFGPISPNTSSNSWGVLPIFNSDSNGISGGVGVNKWQGSMEAGISLTTSWNKTTNTLLDINGDGLLDMLYADNSLGVKLNVGSKFVDTGIWTTNYNLKRESASIAASLNAGFTVALVWKFWLVSFKIPAVNINATPLSTSTNKTKKTMTDFDGDGFVDLVEEVNTNEIKVYHSRIRRTDMLKSVTNPLGGKFTIDYKVQPVAYDNPYAKWTMSDLIVEDGYDKVNDGKDTYKKHFVYENGRYDRREREFYGYKTVKAEDYISDSSGNQILYRTNVSNYFNRSYFLNGLLDDSYVIKGGDINKKYSRTKNFYEIYKLNNSNDLIDLGTAQQLTYDVGGSEGRRSAAVLLVKTITELYELSSSPQLTSEVNLKYDTKGRVVQHVNRGNIADAGDDFTSAITYHGSLAQLNILNVPESIKVSTPLNGIMRERVTEVDSNTGNITKIKVKNGSTWLETKMDFDSFGNLVNILYPENQNGEAMFYKYTYDTDYNKYIVEIRDAYGYASSAQYNSDFDKIIETVDKSGNRMKYDYDAFGRNTLIIAPKELEAGIKYTMRFDYYPYQYLLPSNSGISLQNFVPVAVTSHYDQQHQGDDIETYTFIDGLARPLQVKKDIWLNRTDDSSNPDFYEALSVSGKVQYDELGRSVLQYHPWFEEKTDPGKFLLNEHASSYNATTEFDELDRPVKAIDPEGNISTMQYAIAADNSGALAIKTKSDIDQNGTQHLVTETYKDVFGRVVSTKNQGGSSGSIWTKFKYNGIGELMSYTDADAIATTYKYDMLGRKIMVDHPDNGTTDFTYDNVNLISLKTANLAGQGTSIEYKYEINRPIYIKFPDTPGGNPNLASVYYEYVNSGNGTGNVLWQEDATGEQEFTYGNMGEVVSNIRQVVGPNIPTRIFRTNYEYDSWNRLQSLQYPDGEKVTYLYDLGGNLNQMAGEYNGAPYNYISRIDYDHFGQRTYLQYGNNTETFYSYTPRLRRLENLSVKTSDGNDLFNNKYKYDNVGNVLSVGNSAGITSNDMAGGYSHIFKYDNLNRLVGAVGDFTGSHIQQESGNDSSSSYNLKMEYNNTHGIASKYQDHIKNGNAYVPNIYDNTYKYEQGNHKVAAVIDNSTGETEHFKYDANGNITHRESGTMQTDYAWDESNRLRVSTAGRAMHHYIYDASGERVLKANSDVEAVYENGTLVNSPGSLSINGYTSYPSAFIVITGDGVYSKHYYAGSQRIVSRLGDKDASIFEGCYGCKKEGNNNNFDGKKLQQAQKNDLQHYVAKLKRGKISFKDYKPVPLLEQEKALAEQKASDSTSVGSAVDFMQEVVPIYYYHPDHLGTSTALTDFNGNAYQFFLNLPFGETMAQQLGSNYYNTPYKFNGKELDEETGLYYYGARYYDPKVSIWMSVDPLMESFPNANPYNYCLENPVNFVDPDGMSPDNDYRLNRDGSITLTKITDDKTDKITNWAGTEALIVPKSFLESKKVHPGKNGDNTTIYNTTDFVNSTEQVFNFFARNSHSEFQLQIYQVVNKKLGFVSTGNLIAHAGLAGYINSEAILDKYPKSKLLQDRHSHTDWYEKNGVILTGHYPSGFLPNGQIDTEWNGDRAYRTHFEAKYSPNRLPEYFELIHTKRPGILIKYTDEKYSPLPKKGTTY